MDRRNRSYAASLTLIEMLMKGMGRLMGAASEDVRLPGFLFDMNHFFQSLISRFLHAYLPGFTIKDEHHLKGLFAYDVERNPLKRRPPTPRPDFAVVENGKVLELLDAKYRDLWERSLPREMLYQLALYALSRPGDAPRSTILYPTLTDEATDQVVLMREPIQGSMRARIIMRPVNLLRVAELVRPQHEASVSREQVQFARALVFGTGSSEAATAAVV
jgi:5-methylcytosine-specific restriction enzyme subunit McrC